MENTKKIPLLGKKYHASEVPQTHFTILYCPTGTSYLIGALVVGTYDLAFFFFFAKLLVHIVSFKEQDENSFQLISISNCLFSTSIVGTTYSK